MESTLQPGSHVVIDSDAVNQKNQRKLRGMFGRIVSINSPNEIIVKGRGFELPFSINELKGEHEVYFEGFKRSECRFVMNMKPAERTQLEIIKNLIGLEKVDVMRRFLDQEIKYRNGHPKSLKTPNEKMTFCSKKVDIVPLTAEEKMNRVIGRFMGWQFSTSLNQYDFSMVNLLFHNKRTGCWSSQCGATMWGTREQTMLHMLKSACNNTYGVIGYLRDYNMLFPVIDYIESLSTTKFKVNYKYKFNFEHDCVYIDLGQNTDKICINFYGDHARKGSKRIEAIHTTIFQFAKWYLQNKNL